MPDMSRPGYFAGKGLVLGNLPPDVTEYLRQEAAAAGKTQADIAAEIIRHHLSKSA
jgi:plasmid stability protein